MLLRIIPGLVLYKWLIIIGDMCDRFWSPKDPGWFVPLSNGSISWFREAPPELEESYALMQGTSKADKPGARPKISVDGSQKSREPPRIG